MVRHWQAALVVALLLALAASVYIEGPALVRITQSSSAVTTSASSTSFVSASAPTSPTASSQATTAGSSTSPGDDWTTYHGDNGRTGYEQASNFTSVKSDWNSSTLDGDVYAEPLVYGGEVFVATENNSVYALNATDGGVVWRTNLGTPVPGDKLQCGDIDPTGITGTPAIDPSTGMLYVVSFSSLHHTLSALKVSTGAVEFQRAVDPPGFDVTAQQERSALSLANGMVYIPYGGLDGDCGSYHGWVVALPENGTGSTDVYQVPTGNEGGIWGPLGGGGRPVG